MMPIDPTAPIAQTESARRAQFEADVRRRLDELARRGSTQPPWIPASLMSPWSHYAAGWYPAGYRRDAAGTVQLTGVVKGGVAEEAIFVLPEGFRPAYQLPLITLAGTTSGSMGPIRVDVFPGGAVTPRQGSFTGVGWVSLSSVWFVADDGSL